MQPRQRIPMQRQMGPNMMSHDHFGGHGYMMNHYAHPFGGRTQMMGSQRPFTGGNPMIGQMMGIPQQGRRSGGGLLSKLLGGRKQSNRIGGLGGFPGAGHAVQGSSGGGVGAILKTLSNPEGLTGILNNTQQVLKTAQSIGPMIQQYGPLVKNLPMMWKLYKGFKDLPSEDTAEETTTEPPPVMEEKSAPKKTARKRNTEVEAVETRSHQTGPSLPKLYI